MAENTLQFRWIVTIKEGLDRVFRDRPDVFVAGDLFWYPVEGHPEICLAPDVLVASAGRRETAARTSNGKKGGLPRRSSLRSSRRATGTARCAASSSSMRNTASGVLHLRPRRVVLDGLAAHRGRARWIPRTDGWISPRSASDSISGNELTIYGSRWAAFLDVSRMVQNATGREATMPRADPPQERLPQMPTDPAERPTGSGARLNAPRSVTPSASEPSQVAQLRDGARAPL